MNVGFVVVVFYFNKYSSKTNDKYILDTNVRVSLPFDLDEMMITHKLKQAYRGYVYVSGETRKPCVER